MIYRPTRFIFQPTLFISDEKSWSIDNGRKSKRNRENKKIWPSLRVAKPPASTFEPDISAKVADYITICTLGTTDFNERAFLLYTASRHVFLRR